MARLAQQVVQATQDNSRGLASLTVCVPFSPVNDFFFFFNLGTNRNLTGRFQSTS